MMRARRIASQGGCGLRRRPQLLERQLEGLRLTPTIELQVHHDVVRIVDRSINLIAPHTGLFAADRIAVEGRLPGLEIADGMLDLHNWHECSFRPAASPVATV